jgi:hypothetical protein
MMMKKKLENENENDSKLDSRPDEWGRIGEGNQPERIEWIQFLLKLANSDEVALLTPDRQIDLLSLADGLYRFVTLKVGDAAKGRSGFPKAQAEHLVTVIKARPTLLHHVIEQVRKLLTAAADRVDVRANLAELGFAPQSFPVFRGSRPAGERVSWSSTAPPEDDVVFLQSVSLAAALALNTDEGQLVRRCKRGAPGCRTIFLASRLNQDFCSRKCANAVAFERHQQKIAESQRRRRSSGSSSSPRPPSKALSANMDA